MKYTKTFFTNGEVAKEFDGKYAKFHPEYGKEGSTLKIDMLGMPLITFKWFETGLLDDLPSQQHMDELALLLEEKAKWIVSTFRGKTAPDYFTQLIKEYKSKL
jgi:hypothetical protein